MMLFLVLACPASGLPPPIPPEVHVEPFSCERANVALGHPDATVQMCSEMQHLPGVFSVMLKGPAGFVSRIVLTDEARQVVTEQGPAVAGKFLERHKAASSTDLTLNEIVFALHTAGGLPPGFDPDTMSMDVAGVDRSRLELTPFRLVLLHELVVDPPPQGVAAPQYERGVLERTADGWGWTITKWTGTAFVPASKWPLR